MGGGKFFIFSLFLYPFGLQIERSGTCNLRVSERRVGLNFL